MCHGSCWICQVIIDFTSILQPQPYFCSLLNSLCTLKDKIVNNHLMRWKHALVIAWWKLALAIACFKQVHILLDFTLSWLTKHVLSLISCATKHLNVFQISNKSLYPVSPLSPSHLFWKRRASFLKWQSVHSFMRTWEKRTWGK